MLNARETEGATEAEHTGLSSLENRVGALPLPRAIDIEDAIRGFDLIVELTC